ncbi:MAG: aspartate kinase [Patescibacteria group bacterium]
MNANSHEIERVAKGGGTTMANPLLFAEQLASPGNQAEIVVVSAPGINETLGHDTKLTDLLDSYSQRLYPTRQGGLSIQSHMADIAKVLDPVGADDTIQRVVENVPKDLEYWRQNGAPIMALGEKWSAQIFAAHTDREFVDASHVIRFNRNGEVDHGATYVSIRRELSDGFEYVVPGFYGADSQGRIHLLGRGGSDITGALIATSLSAGSYHNWSDVSGFMTANPALVEHAQLLPEITQREAREMYMGCELLHRDVLRYVGATGIPIHMRNTFDVPTAQGTIVTRERDWRASPIVGVVGKSDLVELALHDFGMNEQVGGTTDVFQLLSENGIPYEHAATSTDDLSIIFEEKYAKNLPYKMHGLEQMSRKAVVRPIGAVRIVGEGLANSGNTRSRLLGRVATAFSDSDIEVFGMTDAPNCASLTFFVNPDQANVNDAVNVAHQAVFEG